jgi:hypothetical protein
MELLLRGLPPRGHLVRADTAGAIAELQDRIAAVDFELSRGGRAAAVPAGTTSTRWAPERGATSQDLWQERVDLMDRLVRVRYQEAGAEAH